MVARYGIIHFAALPQSAPSQRRCRRDRFSDNASMVARLRKSYVPHDSARTETPNNNIGLVQSRHNAEFYGVLTATLALFLRLVFFSGPRGGCIPVLGGEAISAI